MVTLKAVVSLETPNLAGYFFPANINPRNEDGTLNIGTLGVPIFNPLYIQENDLNRKRTYRFLNNTPSGTEPRR